jgi:transcriptional regulator with XRE-family HTH domain
MTLIDNIKHLLKLHKMQQKDLANMPEFGFVTSESTISLILRGKLDPRIEFLIAVAKKFNVSTDDLLFNDVSINNPQKTTKQLVSELNRINAILVDFNKERKNILDLFNKRRK